MADVSMDYDVVESMAKTFGTSRDVLKAVAKALEIASAILKATAMFGMVGNLALARYLDGIKPKCETLADTCNEMQGDLRGAISALKNGDYSGSQRFV